MHEGSASANAVRSAAAQEALSKVLWRSSSFNEASQRDSSARGGASAVAKPQHIIWRVSKCGPGKTVGAPPCAPPDRATQSSFKPPEAKDVAVSPTASSSTEGTGSASARGGARPPHTPWRSSSRGPGTIVGAPPRASPHSATQLPAEASRHKSFGSPSVEAKEAVAAGASASGHVKYTYKEAVAAGVRSSVGVTSSCPELGDHDTGFKPHPSVPAPRAHAGAPSPDSATPSPSDRQNSFGSLTVEAKEAVAAGASASDHVKHTYVRATVGLKGGCLTSSCPALLGDYDTGFKQHPPRSKPSDAWALSL